MQHWQAMRPKRKTDDHALAEQIESLLDEDEVLLWWDKFSDKSVMGGFGNTLTLFTLVINLLILTLIFVPVPIPALGSLGWMLVPLLIVNCICLLFIMLYYAFGLMTGGINAISDQRVLVLDLHKKKIVRHMRLASLSAIRVRRGRQDRGDIVFLRDEQSNAPATARHPRRIAMPGLRHLERVLALLQEHSDVLGDDSQ